MARTVFAFGDGRADGDATMRDILGGKGANLAEMSRLGLPVPPGFTISTEVCSYFHKNNKTLPHGLRVEVDAALADVGRIVGRRFGDTENPLLLSVRSGARDSMPGMMDTVLNLGLNRLSVEALSAGTGDSRFAYDSYRRFVQMYADVVLGLPHEELEHILDAHKAGEGARSDADLTADDWNEIARRYESFVLERTGREFPQDPVEQLWAAISAVFDSWMNRRAIVYRQLNGIAGYGGTAVTIQSMVFGNLGADSATGVMFTRDPSTGERVLYGEFLEHAQGEDVVAGIRTPRYISKAARLKAGTAVLSMEETLPDIHAELVQTSSRLETHFRDMQDVEFTVERGKLWVLQTRAGKRTARAAVRIAVDLEAECMIGQKEAVLRIDPLSLDQLLHPALDPRAPRNKIGSGLPASPGAACGIAVFSAAEAEQTRASGQNAILIRLDTSPEDIGGMNAAAGILTVRGGMTSHAAVVARGMGKPCVCGAEGMSVDAAKGLLVVGGVTIARGEKVTIDGATGEIFAGEVAMVEPKPSPEFATLMSWADDFRRLRVRANAETPDDARTALRLGAEGIGLARTEHMFFEGDRITAVRRMILADDLAGRTEALETLLKAQRDDFIDLFSIMTGLPVTVRLLDPPLHEFLPHTDAAIAELARQMDMEPAGLKKRVDSLVETNPMLGFRGCRLAVAFPDIPAMQARAILGAAAEVVRRGGAMPSIEIMVPLVVGRRELAAIKSIIDDTATAVAAETGVRIGYQVGTMVELPRAALRAGVIAEVAEFFSFGTNDLTQTTYGISRDDAGRFLGPYLERGIFDSDPFVSLDQTGVGELIAIAADRGRATRPDLKLGICGEHGGDPASIDFCERLDLDYVSCSPYRVPIARLAAAQAAIRRLASADIRRDSVPPRIASLETSE